MECSQGYGDMRRMKDKVNVDNHNDKSQKENKKNGNELEEGVGLKGETKFFDSGIRSEWLTTKSASQYLQISEGALRILVHRGQIKAFKFGRRLRFSQIDLFNLIKRKGE